MNFTAIDFETANSQRSSACSVGIAVVRNSEIIDTAHILIRPEPFYFDGFNISIHGIDEDKVRDAETFDLVWNKLQPMILGPLVAHNASFDMSVLRNGLYSYGAPYPDIEYACTLLIARSLWKNAPGYKLGDLANHFNIELDHHNAESDAIACARLAILAGQEYQTKALDGCRITLGYVRSDGTYQPCRSTEKKKQKAKKVKNVQAKNDGNIQITCPNCKMEYELTQEDAKQSYWDDIPLECQCGEIFSLAEIDSKVSDPGYEEKQELFKQFNKSTILKNAVGELCGIAAAVIWDRKIDNSEMRLISGWLAEHKDLYGQWPINDLAKLMYDILEDGIITEDERKRLYNFLVDFAAGPKQPRHVSGIFDDNADIIFEGKHFIFTGTLASGKRNTAENAVTERGGIILKSVTPMLDYLIVGELGSESYANGRFGRKIERAIEIRKSENPQLKIIREKEFIDATFNAEK